MRPWHVIVAAAVLLLIGSTVFGAGRQNGSVGNPLSVFGLQVTGTLNESQQVLLQPGAGSAPGFRCNYYTGNSSAHKGCYFQAGSYGPSGKAYWQWGSDNNNNFFVLDFQNGNKGVIQVTSGTGITIGETGGTNPMSVTLQGSAVILAAQPTLASSTTGAGAQTFTNSPCTGLTTERWVPVAITGQSGTWYVPACQ